MDGRGTGDARCKGDEINDRRGKGRMIKLVKKSRLGVSKIARYLKYLDIWESVKNNGRIKNVLH